MLSGEPSVDPERIDAIKHWFEQLLQEKLKVEPVESWARLWERHIGTISNLISTGNWKLCTETTSLAAYEKAYDVLQNELVDEALLKKLESSSAATGDSFEVAKFLVVMLDEMRISHPRVLEEDYGLSDEEYEHLEAVLHHVDNHRKWDRYESWPAILFSESNCSSASSEDVVPPKYLHGLSHLRIWKNDKTEGKRGPLSEIVWSQRSGELRVARQKDKMMTTLYDRCELLEIEKGDLKSSLRAASQENRRLAKNLSDMTETAIQNGTQCHTLNNELKDWRNKAEKAENEVNELKIQLKTLKQELSTSQTQLCEAETKASTNQNAVDSWQKIAAEEKKKRLKLEDEKKDLLMKLNVAMEAKLVIEKQLRQCKFSGETEIAELRKINGELRINIKALRLEMDEALAGFNEQLIEVQCKLEGIIKRKEVQIAKYVVGFAEMKKQLSAVQSSVEQVRNSASQMRCFRGDLENMRAEIQGLRLLFACVQDGCQVLQNEIEQKKALIKSLQNNAAISEYRAETLALSLEENQKRLTETMTTKEAILKDKEQKLHEAWSQLLASTEMNIRLQEDLKKRDVALQLLEQRFETFEKRYSTMYRYFSNTSMEDMESIHKAAKPISHLPVATDMSSVALPQESHLFEGVGDKNCFLTSSSMSGNPYSLIAGSQCLPTSTNVSEHDTSMNSERWAELNERIKAMLPHLQFTYPAELQRLASQNHDEEELKNSEYYISLENEENASSVAAPCNLLKERYFSRSLCNVAKDHGDNEEID